MKHEDVLNALLHDCCSNPVGEGWNEYRIELHCSSWLIVARPLEDSKYEIRSMQKEYPID